MAEQHLMIKAISIFLFILLLPHALSAQERVINIGTINDGSVFNTENGNLNINISGMDDSDVISLVKASLKVNLNKALSKLEDNNRINNALSLTKSALILFPENTKLTRRFIGYVKQTSSPKDSSELFLSNAQSLFFQHGAPSTDMYKKNLLSPTILLLKSAQKLALQNNLSNLEKIQETLGQIMFAQSRQSANEQTGEISYTNLFERAEEFQHNQQLFAAAHGFAITYRAKPKLDPLIEFSNIVNVIQKNEI